jgi:pseudaminic acid biosynthesis-associated methylase
MCYKTEQENFWSGEFGNYYVQRNSDIDLTKSMEIIISKILPQIDKINSVLELGANIGMNMLAIQNIIPECSLNAVEINEKAVEQLQKINNIKINHGSVFDFSINDLGKHDMTISSGVLIHINPEKLNEFYQRLFECSNKYILIREYYNPNPVEIGYHGHEKVLFKRDFAGELMDIYSDLKLVDYAFQYHRDKNFIGDDSTWFLLEKQ